MPCVIYRQPVPERCVERSRDEGEPPKFRTLDSRPEHKSIIIAMKPKPPCERRKPPNQPYINPRDVDPKPKPTAQF